MFWIAQKRQSAVLKFFFQVHRHHNPPVRQLWLVVQQYIWSNYQTECYTTYVQNSASRYERNACMAKQFVVMAECCSFIHKTTPLTIRNWINNINHNTAIISRNVVIIGSYGMYRYSFFCNSTYHAKNSLSPKKKQIKWMNHSFTSEVH